MNECACGWSFQWHEYCYGCRVVSAPATTPGFINAMLNFDKHDQWPLKNAQRSRVAYEYKKKVTDLISMRNEMRIRSMQWTAPHLQKKIKC